MPTVGTVVAGPTPAAGHAAVDRSTAMRPLLADSATIAPGPVAIVRSPLAVTRASRWSELTEFFDFQVLTARSFPEPTTPAIQSPVANPGPPHPAWGR